MSRFVSVNPPKNLDNEYYSVFCGKLHVEKFAFGWAIFEIVMSIASLFSLFLPQFHFMNSVVPGFVVCIICSGLLLIGCLKSKWWLYVPEIIYQIIRILSLIFVIGYSLILGFIATFSDEETLKRDVEITPDQRAIFATTHFVTGVVLFIFTGLFIYAVGALVRACQFAHLDAKAKTVPNNIVEFKKEQIV
ncbi:hypothetical protein M3Y97_00944500 [Aphelenchoides bicaudatus]|nr:hypothetical protein M3Y97_00944500 [Aphelenchoides bicaudatus]